MYSVVFEADNGKKYVFGKNGNTMFDMNLGDGVTVALGTSQGFSQVGETVENQTVTGRTITAKGVVYGNVPERKRTMRNVLAPFTSGKLIFEGTYYVRVYVKAAPTFSPVRNDGRFTMQFFAPFPFFFDVNEELHSIGAVTPQFRLPVNYGVTHRFGTKSAARYTNIINSGDVRVPFRLHLQSSGTCTNVTVTNLKSYAFLKLNGILNAGDSVDIYRDNDNVVRAELTSGGVVSDIIGWIDEDSTLFELEVGDNLISANDDEGGAALTARFAFNPAVGALYET